MFSNFSKTVYFVDIDDTLFYQQNGLIHIRDYNGKIVESIDNETFNTYKLKPGYSYDHSDFSSSKLFKENALPIIPTVSRLKKIIEINKKSPHPDLILILTARGDFDDKKMILEFFDKEGIPIKEYDFIQFIRTGNISDTIWSTPVKKQNIVLSALITNRFTNFIMVDDSIHNLEKFYEVKQALSDRPEVKFNFIHVIHDTIDGRHCNYQLIDVDDQNAKKYIDIYKAKRILEKYNISIYDPSIADVKIGVQQGREDITQNITESQPINEKENK